MLDPDKVEVVGEDGAVLAKKLYEENFGSGGWGCAPVHIHHHAAQGHAKDYRRLLGAARCGVGDFK